jgi:hypothetical protein
VTTPDPANTPDATPLNGPDPEAPPAEWTSQLDDELRSLDEQRAAIASDEALSDDYRAAQTAEVDARRTRLLESAAECVADGRRRLAAMNATDEDDTAGVDDDSPWSQLLASSRRIERHLETQAAEAEARTAIGFLEPDALVEAYRHAAADGNRPLQRAYERMLPMHLRRSAPQWEPVFQAARRGARPDDDPAETYRRDLAGFARRALLKADATGARTAYARLHRHYHDLVTM